MAEHIRPTTPTPPPTRVRAATANASAAPVTGGLLAASAGTAGAGGAVTHDKADFCGEGYGDVAFSGFGANAANCPEATGS
ncbi:hypothetical protein [Streptomyces sp. NPDC051684]|uniref:hypothetical protein n=1 Tax=Streptomyces sp. NPDC051684 TaxID=3365670 RepID=UPI00379860EF